MFGKSHSIGWLVFLFIYALHAMSPVSMYAVATRAMAKKDPSRPLIHTRADIIWANLILDCLGDDEDDAIEDPSASVRTSVGAQQTGDIVLVRKRRALVRQRLDVKPSIETRLLTRGDLEPDSESCTAYEASATPLLRVTDGYLVLNTGLSPPLFLS